MTESGIRLGDAVEIMRGIESDSVDCVLTDPPYSSGTRKEAQKGIRKRMNRATKDADWFGSDSLTSHGFAHLMRVCALEWHRVLRPGGHVLVFIDWRMMPTLTAAIESADLRWLGVVVWDKCRIGMGNQFRRQHEFVLHYSKDAPREAGRHDVPDVISVRPSDCELHPTQKPVELVRRLLEVAAPAPSRVLDPFSGSGTTAVACQALGLEFIGCDREVRYVDASRERVSGEGLLFGGDPA